MRKNSGVLIISLDFELLWGMADHEPLESAGRFAEVHSIVPRILDLFKKYEIHATWATVGALMAHDDEEFFRFLPETLPEQTEYVLKRIGLHPSYRTNTVPRDAVFAPELVKMILDTPGQEVGSHTYTHYYCNLGSSRPEDFRNEIVATNQIASRNGISCKSVVFPRNRFSMGYIATLSKEGIVAFRGHERDSWLKVFANINWKLFRLFDKLDNYLPLERNMTYPFEDLRMINKVVNVNSSRFFKPYTKRLSKLETLKRNRFKRELKKAAIKGEIYHIYWHPHNFLEDIEKNIETLEWFLNVFSSMRDRYAMQSCSMAEAAEMYKLYEIKGDGK